MRANFVLTVKQKRDGFSSVAISFKARHDGQSSLAS